MHDLAVEFVFDYMVILTDVTSFKLDLSQDEVINTAKDNILTYYKIDLFDLDDQIIDIIIHDKNYGYTPPSQKLGFVQQ